MVQPETTKSCWRILCHQTNEDSFVNRFHLETYLVFVILAQDNLNFAPS